jgi:hypothetical protein
VTAFLPRIEGVEAQVQALRPRIADVAVPVLDTIREAFCQDPVVREKEFWGDDADCTR